VGIAMPRVDGQIFVELRKQAFLTSSPTQVAAETTKDLHPRGVVLSGFISRHCFRTIMKASNLFGYSFRRVPSVNPVLFAHSSSDMCKESECDAVQKLFIGAGIAVFALGIFENFLIIAVMTWDKKLKKNSTNMFIRAIATTDLMISLWLLLLILVHYTSLLTVSLRLQKCCKSREAFRF
jgi:hypothetical protein